MLPSFPFIQLWQLRFFFSLDDPSFSSLDQMQSAWPLLRWRCSPAEAQPWKGRVARADGDPGDVLPGAFPPLCLPPSQLRLLWQAHGKHLAVEKAV